MELCYPTRKKGKVGGTWVFKCNFCNEVRTGSYTRVQAHLLQIKGEGIKTCTKVSRADVLEMQRVIEERKKNAKTPINVPLPYESEVEVDSSSKKRKSNVSSLSPLARCINANDRMTLDQEIARMFYTGGLPFNLARNPHYIRSYTFAASHNIAGYIPPAITSYELHYSNKKRPMLKDFCNHLKQHG